MQNCTLKPDECKSEYLSRIYNLSNSFVDQSLAITVTKLTDEDFNYAESIARHVDDEFLARVVVVTKNKKMIALFDFRENVKLSFLNDSKIKITPIGENMLKHLGDCYGFTYDSNGKPVFL